MGRKVTSSLVSIVRRPCFWLLKGEKKKTLLKVFDYSGLLLFCFKNEAGIRRYVRISRWNVRRDVFQASLLNLQPDSVRADQTSHLLLVPHWGVYLFIYLTIYALLNLFVKGVFISVQLIAVYSVVSARLLARRPRRTTAPSFLFFVAYAHLLVHIRPMYLDSRVASGIKPSQAYS